MKLELTAEQLKTVEIALNELFKSDRWISGREESEIDKIAERAGYLLDIIDLHNVMNSNKPRFVNKQIHTDLLGMVSKHDYSYMMSDSPNVWESGIVYEKHIKAKIHALCAIHREDAEALYNEVKAAAGPDYTDYDSKGYGLKYRVINQWFEMYIGLESISS